MSLNKNKIRKIILQEIRKKILREQEEPAEIQLTPEGAQQLKDLAMKNAELFSKGVKAPNGVSLSESEARALATDLYKATKGGSNVMSGQVLGFGTDEDLIIQTLQKIPSLADLSFVSYIFSQKYKGFFGRPYDLADVLEDEYGTFTSSEFYDVRAEVRGIYDRALFFLDGNPITVAQMEEIARAAQQNADALATVQPGGRDDALADGLTAVGGGASLALGAGAGVGAVLGGAAAYGTTATALGPLAATAASAGAALPGMAGAAAVSAGATSAAAGGGVASGALVGAGSFLGTAGAAAGLSNPVGWVILAVAAVGIGLFVAFDNEEFDEAELKMLSPDFYLKLDEMFKSLSKSFRDKANSIVIPDPEAMEPGDQDTNTSAEDVPDLGFGLEAPFIEKIIITMNKYAETRNLKDYSPCSGKVWTSQVQECWEKFAPHALTNCDAWGEKYDLDSFPSDAKDWGEMSDIMKSDFPRYTKNPKGCLAFCIDAYYCEIRFGKQAVGSSGGGGSSGGDGGGGNDGGSGDGGGSGGGSTGPKLTDMIKVETLQGSPGNGPRTFEAHGFKFNNGNTNISEAIARSIVDNFKNSKLKNGVEAATLNFLAEVDNSGNIVSVRRERGDASARNFERRIRNIDADLLNVMQSLNLPDEDSKSPYNKSSNSFDSRGGRGRGGRGKYIKFTIKIKAGNYSRL